VYGYDVKLLDENTGQELTAPDGKGVVAVEGPLPPGCMQTVWRDDERFVKTYWSAASPAAQVYSTFDWACRDKDGYFFILGRTDDVINVAGHRLGTREIEESIPAHPGQWPRWRWWAWPTSSRARCAMAFAVLKDADPRRRAGRALKLEGEVMKVVDEQLGAVAQPGARALRDRCCPRRAPASCCAAPSRPCARAATPATSPPSDPTTLQAIRDLMCGSRLQRCLPRPRGPGRRKTV
jgi:propionyl-CoA synthetase